jgi:hypothetical protein
MPPAKKGKPAPADLPRTIAHHLDQAAANHGHATRHVQEAAKAKSKAAIAFNLDHATHHAKEVGHKIEEATKAVVKKVPAVGAELAKLKAVTPVAKPSTKPARKSPPRKR